MKRALYKICYFVGGIISYLIRNRIIFLFFNWIFEKSPFYITRRLVKFIKLPAFEWTIILANKRKIITKIYANNSKTAHFAVAYKSHNAALNFTEFLLNRYYDNKIPWIDIGANLGLRSLLALSEQRPVFFIEPNIEVNGLNIERCLLNGFSNYTLYECGASKIVGKAEFTIDATSYSSSLEKEWVKECNMDRIELIPIDTIDNLFKDKIEQFVTACIKIDVEGHELQVLEGADNFIKKLSPTMIIEVNSKGEHFWEFLTIMDKDNYEVFEIGLFRFSKYFRRITSDTYNLKTTIRNNDFLAIKDRLLINIVKKYSI